VVAELVGAATVGLQMVGGRIGDGDPVVVVLQPFQQCPVGQQVLIAAGQVRLGGAGAA
jgi:hypothetical protein